MMSTIDCSGGDAKSSCIKKNATQRRKTYFDYDRKQYSCNIKSSNSQNMIAGKNLQ